MEALIREALATSTSSIDGQEIGRTYGALRQQGDALSVHRCAANDALKQMRTSAELDKQEAHRVLTILAGP